jgi:predicted ATPase
VTPDGTRQFLCHPGRIWNRRWPSAIRYPTARLFKRLQFTPTGLALLGDARQVVERTGERWLEADLDRRKAELLLRQGQSEAAEQLYRKALSIAEEQGAKLWELRAAASLARLRRDQGRRAEARDLLAPVHRWFTEGFDLPDLKEAKALLDELG